MAYISDKQLAANRAYATSSGKARAAQNARKHGFTASTFALAQQSILRAARLEAGLFTTCFNQAFDPAGNPVVLMNSELAGDGDIEITRARLKALWGELPNEAIFEAQPEQNETTCAPPETNPFPSENPVPAPAPPASAFRASVSEPRSPN